ncbi:MAG: DUF1679 domain-containing protein [Bacteriovoracaceae bacterium]|jgi:fructose-1,6-bisphosphatase/inositol monophosphatase family enzyme|nr:DUF1679 domain-containing protein [Bacteriovoracaceae bacterium]
MDSKIKDQILAATNSKRIESTELIQKLWNDYGDLLRIYLSGGEYNSVILKHIKIPDNQNHPKGFSGDISRKRKINSYLVETNWYENYNHTNFLDNHSKTAKKLKTFQSGGEFFILLEDLDASGYSKRLEAPEFKEIKLVLSWLASFHAKFMNITQADLWETGTYWHLETRPDELVKLQDKKLKEFAPLIDSKLSSAKYQTLVHGDAKLANFCFSDDLESVAAVDFQYVGNGTGVRDVAYFIGSCMDEVECKKNESEILDYYFNELRCFSDLDECQHAELESEWRELYPYAWADFHRFLKGWSPDHWKINNYSEKLKNQVISKIEDDLLSSMKSACIEAGKIIMSYYKSDFEISKKEGSTLSSSVVTEVDIKSQKCILENLVQTINTYDLGVLSEEKNDDGSRLVKDFFFAIDPLDGTYFFSRDAPGFSVSIALVGREGEATVGVIYDPVGNTLVHAIKDRGCYINDKIHKVEAGIGSNKKIRLFADQSQKDAINIKTLEDSFEIEYTGGAVINSLNVLTTKNSTYFKYPKKEKGGCAIWDLAAIDIIFKEANASITSFDGEKLSFNSDESHYFNKEGLMVCHNEEILKKIKEMKCE